VGNNLITRKNPYKKTDAEKNLNSIVWRGGGPSNPIEWRCGGDKVKGENEILHPSKLRSSLQNIINDIDRLASQKGDIKFSEIEINKGVVLLLIYIYNNKYNNKLLKDLSLDKSLQDFSKSLPKKKPKPVEKRQREVPLYLIPYLDYWNQHGTMKHIDTSTETFKRLIQLTRRLTKGILYNGLTTYKKYHNYPFSFLDFKRSVDNFEKAAKDPLYFPRNKKPLILSLPNFILNVNAQSKSIMSLSYFMHYLTNDPQMIIEDDRYPNLTKALVRQYTRNVLGEADIKINSRDQQKFVDSAAKLMAFFKKNKKKVNPHFNQTPQRMAKWLWDSIYADVGDSMIIHPGFFPSNKTFELRLPVFLKKQAIILPKPQRKSLNQLTKERRGK